MVGFPLKTQEKYLTRDETNPMPESVNNDTTQKYYNAMCIASPEGNV